MEKKIDGKDLRLVFLTDDVRMICYDCTESSGRILGLHGLGRVEGKLLSQGLLSSLMLAETIKEAAESVSVRIEGSGAIGGIFTECTGERKIRGFVKNHPLDFGNQIIHSIGDVIGAGFMTVVRMSSDGTQRSSSVMLETGLIPNDTAVFFRESEQRNTLVLMDVRFDADKLKSCRGLFIEPLPFCSDERLELIQNTAIGISKNPLPGDMRKMVSDVFGGFSPKQVEETGIEFSCPCDRERFLGIVNALPIGERRKILEGEFPLELVCQYCGRKHYIDRNEINF